MKPDDNQRLPRLSIFRNWTSLSGLVVVVGGVFAFLLFLLREKYPQGPRVAQTIAQVQAVYRDNFFPEMKTNWKVHPNNLGHKCWPGCFRCHDGEHKTADGKQGIKANDCNACHVILA